MSRAVELARAKVNLALHVLGRRAGGYHELDSIVAFAAIADRLSFEPADRFEVEVTGTFAGGVPRDESNLVLKAALALAEAFPGKVRPVRIRLEKNIPVAAGLGGGSADAAATLRGLARISQIVLDDPKIVEIARKLGADVPVCLLSRACRMRGAGEIVEPISRIPLRDAVLVHPGVAVATSAVFGALRLPRDGLPPLDDDLANCRNDLMEAAMDLAPVIAEVLRELENPGLEFARMSGSGAACFGLFASPADAEEAARRIARTHPDWWCRATRLS